MLQRRLKAARDVILEELRSGHRAIGDVHEQDEFVAIVYRYLDAARQGTARLNLRLMAKVVRGQSEAEGLYADEFLRYSTVIASLSREEIVFLAKLHQHFGDASGDTPRAFRKVCDELIGSGVFRTMDDVQACAAALQRTGLVSPVSLPVLGGAGFFCKPARLLALIMNLASFEHALQQEPEQRVEPKLQT